MQLVVEHKHQHAHDVAHVYASLQKFGLEQGGKVNIEVNHATLAGHSSLNPRWRIVGGTIYSRLVADAADSPVVAQRGSADQFTAGVGVASAW